MARLFWPYRGRGPMQKRGWPDPNGQVYAGPLTLRLGRVVTARFARLHSAAQTKCQRCVEHVCQRCVETAHGPALPTAEVHCVGWAGLRDRGEDFFATEPLVARLPDRPSSTSRT